MIFSLQQEQARVLVRQWLADENRKPIFRLFGYAGTGKSTIANDLASEVDGQVLFATFTGKAALVLRAKGCPSAQTIHSLIYIPRDKSVSHLATLQAEIRTCEDVDRRRELQLMVDAEKENLRRPSFSLNLESPLRDAKLLGLDEVSMVGRTIAEDLLTFGCPILALGDPAQLPPVKDTGYFTDAEPDFMLTEIHRQAEGSPIIHLATQVRNGKRLVQGEYGSSRVIPKGTLSIQELAAHDQIIVGRNATRHVINRRIRTEVKGYEGHLPVAGDILVCLRNDRDSGLLNGSQWEVQACHIVDEDKLGLVIRQHGVVDSYPFEVIGWRHYFEDREKDIPHYEMKEAQAFQFGYALTAHKAQGSQYGSVAIVDESSCFQHDAKRWLYTAITRASEKVTVIQ